VAPQDTCLPSRTSISPTAPTVSTHHPELWAGSLIVADVTCPVRQCAALKIENSAFCGDHTCRERDCLKATTSDPYCEDRESASCFLWTQCSDENQTAVPSRVVRILEAGQPTPSILQNSAPYVGHFPAMDGSFFGGTTNSYDIRHLPR
jgi:hypothetical protein